MSEFIKKDSFARLLGIEILSAENGKASAQMAIQPEHHNGHGSVHGGVMFSLADIAFAAASNTNAEAIGIQADIRYMAKPEGNLLRAEAFELNATRKLGNYQIDVFDEPGNKVAQFSGMVYRF